MNTLRRMAVSRKVVVSAVTGIANVLLTVLWKDGSVADKATIVSSLTALAMVYMNSIAKEDAAEKGKTTNVNVTPVAADPGKPQ